MKQRFCVVGIIRDKAGNILILRSPEQRGVYPAQWGLVGGGIDAGETIEAALRREAQEEIGITLTRIEPWWYFDDIRSKVYPDKTQEELYMVYLMFEAEAVSTELRLNDEWIDYVWVKPERLIDYDLNAATVKTFKKKGWL